MNGIFSVRSSYAFNISILLDAVTLPLIVCGYVNVFAIKLKGVAELLMMWNFPDIAFVFCAT